MQKTIIGILLSCSILLSGCTRTYKVDYPQKYAKLLTEQLGDWKVVDSFERHFSGKFSLPYNATFWEIEYTDYKGNAGLCREGGRGAWTQHLLAHRLPSGCGRSHFLSGGEHTSGHDADQSAAAGGKGDRRGFQPAL